MGKLMIDLSKYGTAKEVSEKTGVVNRTTLSEAVKRKQAGLEIVYTIGGTPLVSAKSVRKVWGKNPPARGPKPKSG